MQQEQVSGPLSPARRPTAASSPRTSCDCRRHLGSWPKGSTKHRLPQRPFDKRTLPTAGSAGSLILWNFLCTTFSWWRWSLVCAGSSERTWPGRRAGVRDARRGRSRSPRPAPRHRPSGYHSHEGTRQPAGMLVGFTAGECVYPRTLAVPPAGAPRAPNSGR